MATDKTVVLMLEDEPDLLQMCHDQFEGVHGHPFLPCKTVEEAIKVLHDTPGKIFACVDIRMKGSTRSGYELLTYIKENLSHRVTACAFTGENSLIVEAKALRAGAIYVFHKSSDSIDRIVLYAQESVVLGMAHNAFQDEFAPVFRFYYFQHRVKVEMKTARERRGDKYPEVFSILFIDPSGMKQVNDYHGPWAGDRVLEMIGSVVKNNVRPTDSICCRKSGDKFLVWLPNVDRATALDIGEKIGQLVWSTPVKSDNGVEFHVSVACGVAELRRENITSEEETKQLDQLIMEAYQASRSR